MYWVALFFITSSSPLETQLCLFSFFFLYSGSILLAQPWEDMSDDFMTIWVYTIMVLSIFSFLKIPNDSYSLQYLAYMSAIYRYLCLGYIHAMTI